jgi:hypothetical protein
MTAPVSVNVVEVNRVEFSGVVKGPVLDVER